MKNKYIFIIASIILLNTSCTSFIGYGYKDYTDLDNIIVPYTPKDDINKYINYDNYDNYDNYYNSYNQGRYDEHKLQEKKKKEKDDAWNKLIKVPSKPGKIVYKYGKKYKLVETERTYRFYKDKSTLYRYVDSYDDTYESDVDLGYRIYRNGRYMRLELFKDPYTGNFYVED